MNLLELLVWLTGFDRGGIPQDASLEFTWMNPVQSWGIFVYLSVLAALAYFVFFLYRLEQQSAPRKVKILLAGMRMFVVLLLAIIFLGPAVTFNEERSLAPFVVVLRDASQSMNGDDLYLADEDAALVASVTDRSPADVSRAELVDMLLARDDGKLLAYLDKNTNLRVFDFSVDTIPATWISGDAEEGAPSDRPNQLAPLQAEGRGTDIYRALNTAMTLDPLAAIVVFTDGQHTRPESNPLELVDPALEGKVPPIFVIGVGDPTPPRDVRVTAVRADRVAYPDNPFPVEFILHTSGIEATSLSVELLEFDVNDDDEVVGAGRVVDRKEFELSDRNTLRFIHVKSEPGTYAYTVRVAPLEHEQDVENNQFQTPARVDVREEEAKVLLIAGAPTWEYRFATQLLTLDPSVHLNCWLQTLDPDMPQEGNAPSLTRIPSTKEALFEYSVIMLFDPDPRDFDEQWMDLLKEFVSERAGGVLYMAGPKFSGLFLMSPRTATLADMLPIRVGDIAGTELGARHGTNTRSWDLRVVEKNVDQPIMAFFPERERSLAIWDRLPGPYWSFPATDIKPGSRMLIDQSDPDHQVPSRPLLVTGRYGAGRTVYIGFNGTWRWRRPLRIEDQDGNAHWINGESLYKRFWLQTVGYLIEGRLQEGKRRGWIRTERDQYEVGERIAVTAQLFDATQEPLTLSGDQLDAWLQSPDGSETPVHFKAVPNQPGAFEMVLAARRTGYYRLEIRLPGGPSDTQTLERPVVYAEFTVTLPEMEFNQPELDKSMLRQLAEMSGGAYLEIDEFDRLIDLIKINRQSIIVPGTARPLWDTANILLLIVGFLSVEWLVRKAYKLL